MAGAFFGCEVCIIVEAIACCLFNRGDYAVNESLHCNNLFIIFLKLFLLYKLHCSVVYICLHFASHWIELGLSFYNHELT